MSISLKAGPPPDSDEESLEEDDLSRKRMKLIRELSELEKPSEKFVGGIVISSDAKSNLHSASASLTVAEKKGRKEVEELKRELDLKNTFSNETNRRDEDAEMNKYIEEQIRLRREAAKSREENPRVEPEVQESELFALPSTEATERVDDILLHSLSKSYSSTVDERSEVMLSSQMLNGIPEIDLGVSERMRTVEATEEAKLRLASGPISQRNNNNAKSKVPSNFSSNFQQHRQSKYKDDHQTRHTNKTSNDSIKTITEPVVSVGEEPKEVEYRVPTTGERRAPQKGKASDDYHLQKFKKNSRR